MRTEDRTDRAWVQGMQQEVLMVLTRILTVIRVSLEKRSICITVWFREDWIVLIHLINWESMMTAFPLGLRAQPWRKRGIIWIQTWLPTISRSRGNRSTILRSKAVRETDWSKWGSFHWWRETMRRTTKRRAERSQVRLSCWSRLRRPRVVRKQLPEGNIWRTIQLTWLRIRISTTCQQTTCEHGQPRNTITKWNMPQRRRRHSCSSRSSRNKAKPYLHGLKRTLRIQ